MKQVTINLYSFSELNKDAKAKAIEEHKEFLRSEHEPYNTPYVIENIELNDYIFFSDGELANCVTYTDGHPKTGITEFNLHGSTYQL